jgi:hypothetical protein
MQGYPTLATACYNGEVGPGLAALAVSLHCWTRLSARARSTI